jgi:FdhE protein
MNEAVVGVDAGQIAPLRLPDVGRVFRQRAARFDALAPGHAAAPFLALLASITRAQDLAAAEIRARPGAAPLQGVPLHHERWQRSPAWRAALRVVLGACRGGELPGPARDAIARLERASEEELESLADDVLGGAPRDLACAPFVGSALQVYFTRLAAGMEVGAAGPAAGSSCPVCASPPVASVVLGTERLRYLVCSLCAAEWHLPRVQCFLCRSAAAVSYFSIEGAPPGGSAEACEACRSYLKLFDLQERPGAEALADDAATLVLDLLMDERSYRRAGVNLLSAGEAV